LALTPLPPRLVTNNKENEDDKESNDDDEIDVNLLVPLEGLPSGGGLSRSNPGSRPLGGPGGLGRLG
jgi:hypothetical protein